MDRRELFVLQSYKWFVVTTLAHRRSICRWLIGIIVSAQLAVAAFACAGQLGLGASDPTAAKAVAMANHGAAVPWQNGGMDPTSQNLCLAHCQYGQQNADSSAQINVPVALLTTLYTLRPLGEAAAHVRPLAAPWRPQAAADPPHAILHCCLRD